MLQYLFVAGPSNESLIATSSGFDGYACSRTDESSYAGSLTILPSRLTYYYHSSRL